MADSHKSKISRVMKQVNGIANTIEKLQSDVFDNSFLIELASFARDKMVARTRLGFGVSSTDDDPRVVTKVPLKVLSENYKKFRKDNLDKLGKFGKPTKSNLTFTGQMLDDISFEITDGGFKIDFKNKARQGSKVRNSDIASYQEDQGRMFFNMTKEELEVLLEKVRRRYRKVILQKLTKLGGLQNE